MVVEAIAPRSLAEPEAYWGALDRPYDPGTSDASVTAAWADAPALRKRIDFGGVFVDQISLVGAVQRMREFFQSGAPHQIVTVNLDFLSIARRRPEFRDVINQAHLAVADGMPLVWLSRLKRQILAGRVTGVDLVHEGCCLAAARGQGVFLLGGAPGVADAAARRLEERYPGLRVQGVYTPSFGPLSAEEDAHIVRLIREAAPALLLVALGAPRQDLWIHTHLQQIGVPVCIGVGCVFDLLAGAVNRAPAWMQQAGLEWAFRLAQEPRRLWRRYFLNDVPTLARLVLSTLGGQLWP